MAYRNNLQKDDRVIHSETKRPGTVKANPREAAVMVGVQWQGTDVAQYVHISKLRLVVDGKPEEVPPCDGEPPEHGPRSHPAGRTPARVTVFDDDPASVLRAKRDANLAEQAELNKRFSALKAENDRIEIALKALTA